MKTTWVFCRTCFSGLNRLGRGDNKPEPCEDREREERAPLFPLADKGPLALCSPLVQLLRTLRPRATGVPALGVAVVAFVKGERDDV